MYGPVVEQGIWRIRTNQKLYKDLDIVADIETKRLEGRAKLLRMDYERIVKKA
jgi:hypothetical protein